MTESRTDAAPGTEALRDGADAGPEVDRPGWFAACMAPHTTARDLRNTRRFGLWMIAWAASTIVPGMLGVPEGDPTRAALLAGGLSFALFLGAVWAMVRFIRETDELNRVIQMRSIGVGFATGVVFAVGADILLEAGVMEVLDIDLVMLVMLLATAVAQAAWTASYR